MTQLEQRIADEIKNYILVRTRNQHLDYKDDRFPNYTEAYAKQKGISVDNVTLSDTGHMLDSFHVEVLLDIEQLMKGQSGSSIIIEYSFTDPFAQSKYEWNALRPGKNRDFLGSVHDVDFDDSFTDEEKSIIINLALQK